jgi:hypothetical protein
VILNVFQNFQHVSTIVDKQIEAALKKLDVHTSSVNARMYVKSCLRKLGKRVLFLGWSVFQLM